MFSAKHRQMFGLFVALISIFTIFFGTSVIRAQETPTLVELTGIIQAMDAQTITINGQVIQIDTAELQTALELGKEVKIHVQSQDGQLIATEIVDPATDTSSLLTNEIEIVGLLSTLDGTTITVGGILFDITDFGLYAGAAVGDLVSIKATLDANGQLVILEVEQSSDDNSNDNTADNSNDNTADNSNDNTDDNSNDNTSSTDFVAGEFEVVGTINALDGTTITIGGITIDLGSAEIRDALMLGATVKLHASLVDGVIVIHEIETFVPSNDNTNNDNSNDNSVDDNSNDNLVDDNSNDNAVVVPADCVPVQPEGWTVYTIQPGDTFSAIANGADADMSDLALANCVTDTGLVIAGVTVFVPQAPVMDNSNGTSGDDDSNDNGDDSGGDSSNDNGDDSNDNGDDNGGD
jgi:LysM repeat protein